MTKDQKKIQEYLMKKYNNQDIQWPSGIIVSNIDEINNKIESVTLTLCEAAAGLTTNPINMQKEAACFEGWAVALKAAGIEKINLNVNGISSSTDFETGKGHYGRFLYRALRFSEQYEWFHLCGDVKGVVDSFQKFLEDNNNKFINNGPGQDDAGTNDKLECRVETKMADKNENAFLDYLKNAGCPVEKDQKVYRQLPVSLFLKTVENKNQVFTGGASAIDLWTMNGDVLQVVELKADNKMVGIITEIFFYSNFMYDLLFGKFLLNPDLKKRNRGYTELMEKKDGNIVKKKDGNIEKKKFKKIQGIMLADVYHPLITPDVLGVLNAGSKKDEIQYFKAEYDFDVTIKKK